jgi:hypothetical protein
MNEDGGVVSHYIQLDPKAVVGNIFEPKTRWTSVSSSGKITTKVSYNKSENATVFFQENRFMIANYTWAKVVTNPAHDKILSVAMSSGFDKESNEDDRGSVLNCSGPK